LKIYFSTDGRPPAEETATQLLIHGQPYQGPFSVTETTQLRVSTVKWGLAVGQRSLPIKIQVEKPMISPSPRAGEILPSPVLVSIGTQTTGATIKYRLSSSEDVFVYQAPFAVNSVSTVTSFAEKEGALQSAETSVAFALKATTPVISPAAGYYVTDVSVNMSTDTVLANVYVTVCNVSVFPGWSNKSIGEIYQTREDVYCYPNCKGLCEGGYNDQKPCGGAHDLLTCGGGGMCMESYHTVRLCYPNEWPPGRVLYSEPIIINQTQYGSGAWVTSYASRQGMADSNLTSHQYNISTIEPTLHLLPHLHPAPPWPNPKEPALAIPFLEHGQDEGPFPSPLSFNFSNPTPADIYYTLDGSHPTPGAPGTVLVPYQEILQPLLLNRTVNLTWVGKADNLSPSPPTSRTIAVQAVTPELMVDVRYKDKASGTTEMMRFEGDNPNPMTDLKVSLVTGGFAYPGLDGQVDPENPLEATMKYFSERFDQNPPMHGYPLLSMRAATQDAHVYYRLLNGTNDSTILPSWPATGVRSGVSEPDTAEGLRARGWIRYSASGWAEGPDVPIYRNYTVEIMAAAPGTSLINSNVMAYPLFLRERCENGQASADGWGPCALCPLDTYMECADFAGTPPCLCKACSSHVNDTGTFEPGASSQDLCKPFCRPGTFSRKEGIDENMTNCTACGLGTYEDRTRSTECKVCPAGTSTWRYGADNIAACRGAGGLDAGGFHSCGIDIDGIAKCWGYNGFGQTEVPKKLVQWEENGVPYAEERQDEWYSVAAGSFHSCGITTAFKAKCWGQEFAGKTRVPTMHLWGSPEMPLQEVVEWQAISASAGYHHSCGIADRRALCWGDDEYGQTQVPGGRYWQTISAGQFHTCGVDSVGNALCWGDNSYGQSDVPAVVDEGPWRNVSAGHYHSCGLTSIGKMHCWGSALYGATSYPQEVESWSSVAVGRYHTCGVTFHGIMRCWGSDQDGAISVPDHISRWRAVTAGLFHTCGISEDRTGLCWGRTVYGLTILPEAVWSSV